MAKGSIRDSIFTTRSGYYWIGNGAMRRRTASSMATASLLSGQVTAVDRVLIKTREKGNIEEWQTAGSSTPVTSTCSEDTPKPVGLPREWQCGENDRTVCNGKSHAKAMQKALPQRGTGVEKGSQLVSRFNQTEDADSRHSVNRPEKPCERRRSEEAPWKEWEGGSTTYGPVQSHYCIQNVLI